MVPLALRLALTLAVTLTHISVYQLEERLPKHLTDAVGKMEGHHVCPICHKTAKHHSWFRRNSYGALSLLYPHRPSTIKHTQNMPQQEKLTITISAIPVELLLLEPNLKSLPIPFALCRIIELRTVMETCRSFQTSEVPNV